MTKTQVEENVITTGCIDVKIENELNQINLGEAYPIEDSDGLELKPFTFTVTNKCNVYTDYEIGLEMLSNTNLESKYVKVLINQVGIKKYPKLLSSYEKESKTIIDGAKEGRILLKGKLNPSTKEKEVTKNYELRLWIDNDSPQSIMNQTFTSKIVINGSQGSEPNIADYIEKLIESDQTNLAYDDTNDQNLRYIGKEVNNYIDIGDRDSEDKPILWRIIGVMNNMTVVGEDESESTGQSLVKIIRADSIGNWSWDTSENEVNGGRGVNEWSEADLMTTLNEKEYWSKTNGECYNGTNESQTACDFSSTGLTESVKDKLVKVRWNTGTFATYNESDWLANATYQAERSNHNGKTCNSGNYCTDKVPRTTTWDGYIGLMYPSDYGFAIGGEDRNRCLTTSMVNWHNSNSNCKNNDWLYDSSSIQWTITPVPYPSDAYTAFIVAVSESISNSGVPGIFAVRPTAYLDSNIKIQEKDDSDYGSQSNPFVIME